MSLYAGICLYAEHRHGTLSSVVAEIIGAARELKKDLDRPISAILLGSGVRLPADKLFSYGVDQGPAGAQGGDRRRSARRSTQR